jgi:hypothetical protein
MSEQITELFNACVEQGLDKDATIMKLATEGGLNVTQAVREYLKLAKSAGLVLPAKERTEKVNELLAENDVTDADVRKELIVRISEEFDISEATAAAHIRKYAEENGIELPSQQRTSLEDMVQFVKDQLDDNKARADIVTALQHEMGYTANSASSAYSRATRELGISAGRKGTTVPLEQTVAFIRERQNMPRKDLTAAMVEELGYAESTANSFLTYVNFAKEWAKQENAA